MRGALLRALMLYALVTPANLRSVLHAQDTRSLRDGVRNITRGIERGEEQKLRQRLRNVTDRRDASAALETAALERLTFRAADAERTYRSLLTNDSPTVRAHASVGLASLFAQSARYGDAVVWFDSAGKHFAAFGDSAGRSESYLGQSQGLLRTSGVAASRAALTRAQVFAPRSDDWMRVNLACSALMLRVRAADAVPMPAFHEGRRLAHDVSARAEALCLLAQAGWPGVTRRR